MAGLNNWLDSVEAAPGYVVEAFDSMFFNNFDSFVLSLGVFGGGGGADQLVLTDGISIQLSIALSFGDSLSFADSFGGTFLSVNSFGDTLSMSDLLGLQMNLGLIFTDSMNLNDGFLAGTNDQLLISVSDTLNFWLDGFASLSSTSETTYLRQYLNDVIN